MLMILYDGKTSGLSCQFLVLVNNLPFLFFVLYGAIIMDQGRLFSTGYSARLDFVAGGTDASEVKHLLAT